jgi:DNA-binding response OmpR family regulator
VELSSRVLVVEDDAVLRGQLARGLREHGLAVTAVRDGTSALAAFGGDHHAPADGPFDAIVLDIGLPDSDGRDVCQALRARGVLTPVMFLTARGQMTDLLSGFAAGGDEYLAKLRRKLRSVDPSRTIVTAHGVGYEFR